MSEETRQPKRRELRVRIVTSPSGEKVEEFCCTRCTEWKPRSAFPEGKTLTGIRGTCLPCDNERVKESYRRNIEKRRAANREYARRRKAAEVADREEADQQYRLWLEGQDPHQFVRVSLVRPWVERLMEREGGKVWNVAAMCHVNSGTIKRILADVPEDEEQWVLYTQAEKIATASDNLVSLSSSLHTMGVEGWSPHGDICCRDCGTIWHPHHGLGRCYKCYNQHHHATKNGRPRTLTRDQYRWSLYFPCCQSCGTRDRKHQGRGLCTRCVKIHRKKGTLHMYPPLTRRGEHVAARMRGGDHGQAQAG